MASILKRIIPDIYSDINSKLEVNPINDDITRVVDEESIKTSMRNLLLTNRGERLFKPLLGSNIKKMLFENITPDILVILREYIISTLEVYEPRINIIDVNVLAGRDENSIDIQITFNIQKSETAINFSLIINRVR